jgi:hypothetical protein
MGNKPVIQPAGSPVPGVIPEPWRVEHDTGEARQRPPAAVTTRLRSRPRTVLARLLDAVRGEKHTDVRAGGASAPDIPAAPSRAAER